MKAAASAGPSATAPLTAVDPPVRSIRKIERSDPSAIAKVTSSRPPDTELKAWSPIETWRTVTSSLPIVTPLYAPEAARLVPRTWTSSMEPRRRPAPLTDASIWSA